MYACLRGLTHSGSCAIKDGFVNGFEAVVLFLEFGCIPEKSGQ